VWESGGKWDTFLPVLCSFGVMNLPYRLLELRLNNSVRGCLSSWGRGRTRITGRDRIIVAV
jgi:hypothetical protein